MSSNTDAIGRAEKTEDERSIIDCDIHQTWASEEAFAEYLPEHFRSRGVSLPSMGWENPIGEHGVQRDDAVPASGDPAGSDYELLAEQLLDEYGIDHGILTGGTNLGAGVHPNADYATALTRAYNDWLLDTWLSYDDRLYGSVAVAPQAPREAAEEIDRVGDHDRMLQVILPSVTRDPFGKRRYWPIYEAAEDAGLPVALHVGPEAKGISGPHTGAGYPSTYAERHTVIPAVYFGQLTSLVFEGVLERFPDLSFVFVEGGFGWVPHLLWRMDKNWKGLKDQIPWVVKPPSEYVREQVRFTSQPSEEPERAEHLRAILEMIHAEETLMFATDYPHWDGDAPAHAFPPLPDDLERRILFENARELYGL